MKRLFVFLVLPGIIFSGILYLGGCVLLTNSEQISTLQGLAASQKEMDSYIKEEERGFGALKEDLKEGRLRPGLSKKEALARYAEPVLCKKAIDKAGQESCLFRNPVEYFDSDCAYLYFDEKGNLTSWEFLPGSQKQVK